MPAKEPTWTDERIERLKNRFAAGLTCRQIAADIGVSRNAVIGKLSRLNLTREKTVEPPRLPRTDQAKGRRPRSGARGQYAVLVAAYAEPRPAVDDQPIHNEHCCSLLELSEERCRWPISTPGAEDFRFCGNTPVDGLPYCAGHTRLAYRPGARLRVARG
jgi:GcrA cell cycle regulator